MELIIIRAYFLQILRLKIRAIFKLFENILEFSSISLGGTWSTQAKSQAVYLRSMWESILPAVATTDSYEH